MEIRACSCKENWQVQALQGLDAGMKCRLTLLVAASVDTRTDLLARWTECCPFPVVRLNLTQEHNSPARFFAYLAHELDSLGIEYLGTYTNVYDAIAIMVDGILRIPGDLILILDNYDVLSEPLLHQAMRILLEFTPPLVHLVIASRTEPPLPLARLRAHRQLVEIMVKENPLPP
jgi:LuxR family transcriptional regulator, maltose regulon positive regulatory protein